MLDSSVRVLTAFPPCVQAVIADVIVDVYVQMDITGDLYVYNELFFNRTRSLSRTHIFYVSPIQTAFRT